MELILIFWGVAAIIAVTVGVIEARSMKGSVLTGIIWGVVNLLFPLIGLVLWMIYRAVIRKHVTSNNQ